MELDDHEEEDMEIERAPTNHKPLLQFQTHPLSRLNKNPTPVHSNRPLLLLSNPSYNYKECLKNHAITVGGHALDGCGEFMPAGPADSLEALKCAACNCHRNFHRKDAADEEGQSSPPFVMSYWPRGLGGCLQVAPHRRTMLALPSPTVRKRVRTKFTEEQKEKMVAMAEKLEWRIEKSDEGEVMEFCNEIGVKRRVLKVWMHNNKNSFRKEYPHKTN